MILRRATRALAAAALALTSLTVGAGTASASVWQCGGPHDWCTTAAYDVGVYTAPDGAYMYTLYAGETFLLNCYGYGGDNSIWYTGLRAGWANGWVPGDGLTTGHDPNPNIGYCW